MDRREVVGPICADFLRFRRFRVAPRAREVLVDGRPIELGSRAFDLLVVLLNARGDVVTKEEIVSRVWPSTIVDEGNLRFQMTVLRKALGEDRDVIKTVPGRGYLFAAEVMSGNGDAHDTLAPDTLAPDTPILGTPAPEPAGAPLAWRTFDHQDVERFVSIPKRPTSALKIAVIDDDRDIREALDGLLRSVGLNVELFASVQDFMDTAREAMPDCLILDVWMPGGSGLDFYDELVKAHIDLPVIFVSGHADVRTSVRAMKAGAVEFLTKPVHYQDLLTAIDLAIGRDGAPHGEAERR